MESSWNIVSHHFLDTLWCAQRVQLDLSRLKSANSENWEEERKKKATREHRHRDTWNTMENSNQYINHAYWTTHWPLRPNPTWQDLNEKMQGSEMVHRYQITEVGGVLQGCVAIFLFQISWSQQTALVIGSWLPKAGRSYSPWSPLCSWSTIDRQFPANEYTTIQPPSVDEDFSSHGIMSELISTLSTIIAVDRENNSRQARVDSDEYCTVDRYVRTYVRHTYLKEKCILTSSFIHCIGESWGWARMRGNLRESWIKWSSDLLGWAQSKRRTDIKFGRGQEHDGGNIHHPKASQFFYIWSDWRIFWPNEEGNLPEKGLFQPRDVKECQNQYCFFASITYWLDTIFGYNAIEVVCTVWWGPFWTFLKKSIKKWMADKRKTL